jgi:hypothetical protein
MDEERERTAWPAILATSCVVFGLAVYFCESIDINPWPVTLVFIIWGGFGVYFGLTGILVIEYFKRRALLREAIGTDEYAELKNRPLPWHPGVVVLIFVVSGLSGYFAWDTYGLETTAGWTVAILIVPTFAIFFYALVSLQRHAQRDKAEFEKAVKQSGGQSILMRESAHFPSEEEHKRSGKFK